MASQDSGSLQIPKREWWQLIDHFTRIDELLETNLKLQKDLLESLRALLPAPPAAPPAPPRVEVRPIIRPPPTIVKPPVVHPEITVQPAPVELRPLAERLDLLNQSIGLLSRGNTVLKIGRYSGTSTTYHTVVEWTVGTFGGLAGGMLSRIGLMGRDSTDYERARWQITIGKNVVSDIRIDLPHHLPFHISTDLKKGDKVRVEVRTTGGEITVNSYIVAKEW